VTGSRAPRRPWTSEPARHARSGRRHRVAALLVTALTLVLVGCAALWWHQAHRWQAAHAPARTEARTGDPDIPAIDWPNGLPDDGRWADDPWVTTLRELTVVLAAAYDAGDLTGSSDLHRLVFDRYIDSYQETATDARERAAGAGSDRDDARLPVFPGPMTLTVLDVQETYRGTTVRTCQTSGLVTASPDVAADRMADGRGRVVEWHLALDAAGVPGVYEIDVGEACEVEDVRYGLFDPLPENGRTASTAAEGSRG
jgi:hypothetical protein